MFSAYFTSCEKHTACECHQAKRTSKQGNSTDTEKMKLFSWKPNAIFPYQNYLFKLLFFSHGMRNKDKSWNNLTLCSFYSTSLPFCHILIPQCYSEISLPDDETSVELLSLAEDVIALRYKAEALVKLNQHEAALNPLERYIILLQFD